MAGWILLSLTQRFEKREDEKEEDTDWNISINITNIFFGFIHIEYCEHKHKTTTMFDVLMPVWNALKCEEGQVAWIISSIHHSLPLILTYSSLTFNDNSNLGILMLITTFFFCEWGREGILLLSIDLYIKSWQFNCYSQNMSLYPKSHHLIVYKKYRKERIEEK